MEIQISGEKLERTGRKNSDIYLSFFDKKFYLKKAINRFAYYDKIEERNGCYNKIIYFEKKGKNINLDRNSVIKEAEAKLHKSLEKTLSSDACITESKVTVEDVKEGTILVKIIFTVEQDIAQNIS
jgi:similar to stage IV sporulation protein